VAGRPLRAGLLLALAAVLLSGCRATLVVDVTVDRRGAGRLEIALGADAALLERAAAAGADPLGDLAATGRSLADEGWQTTDEADAAGGRTVALSAPFSSPEAFDALAAQVADALAAPEVTLLDGLRLVEADGRIALAGTAGLVPTAAVTELGVQPAQAVTILEETGALAYEVRLDLPGEVLEAGDGAAVDGERVTWAIAPGEQVALSAVATVPGAPWWVLVISGTLGGLLGLLALRGLRRLSARG
jgi:hypothetical protein